MRQVDKKRKIPNKTSDQTKTKAQSKLKKIFIKENIKWIVLLVLLIVVASFASYKALNSSITETSNNSEGSQPLIEHVTIQITESGFQPSELVILAGTKVIWENKDDEPHFISGVSTDINDDSGFESSMPIGPDDSYEFTFTSSADYSYYDKFNPELKGNVYVK